MRKLGTLFLLMVLPWFGQGAVAAQKAEVDLPATWTDTVTGLMWTTKDNESDVTWQQAVSYCQNLKLSGNSDWRLPEVGELQSIYDSAANVPGRWQDDVPVQFHIKGNLMLTGWHWSSTQSDPSGKVWTFDFFMNAKDPAQPDENRYGRALCVRRAVIVNPAGQDVGKVPLAEEPTWTDHATGLMWAREDNRSNVVWKQASSYCTTLQLGGYSGWRLPTIDELQGIYDESVGGGHITGGIRITGWLWSNSAGNASGEKCGLGFADGERGSFRLDIGFGRALCVRQSGK